MFSPPLKETISRLIDRFVLYMISRGTPDQYDQRDVETRSLEEIVAQTRIDQGKTNLYNLVAPGEHALWLETPLGEIQCHVRVRLGVLPQAPLLLYHHGLLEVPYTRSWYEILPKQTPFPAHLVAVQAPYHQRFNEPLGTGFSSVDHIYQMFAGSLRIYELIQEQFEGSGAAYTVTSGFSWGGVTSLLYEALFARARATVPMFASPNLAQVMVDGAKLSGRGLPAAREVIDEYFDFTPVYERCDRQRIFPVMGKDDLFFRFEKHAPIYPADNLQALNGTHVGATWSKGQVLRDHLLQILRWADKHPR